MANILKEYLGDGIYASWDGFQIALKANHPEYPTDTVYLDPSVVEAFERFRKEIAASLKEEGAER